MKSPFGERRQGNHIKRIEQVENRMILIRVFLPGRAGRAKGICINRLKQSAVHGIGSKIIRHRGRTAVPRCPETQIPMQIVITYITFQTFHHSISGIIEPFDPVIIVDRHISGPFTLIVVAGNGYCDQNIIPNRFISDRGADRINRRDNIKIICPGFVKPGLSEEIQNIMIFLRKINRIITSYN